MTEFFDGKAFAVEKEKELKSDVEKLKALGIIPKMTSIIIGNNFESNLYQNLKKKAAERIGASLTILNFTKDVELHEVLKRINGLNSDKSIHGIMIQLPLPDNFSKSDRNRMINSIEVHKDVDGLRDDSIFTSPVVKAVINAIPIKDDTLKTAVIGASGFEGKKITRKLLELGYQNTITLDRSDNIDLKKKLLYADIIISAAGQPDLIKPEIIKEGTVLIDVGSPQGDISKDCYKKASYVSPVPGGIGPVTITCLMENLVLSAQKIA